jgi:ABC-2 type transport system ATP-binding protein
MADDVAIKVEHVSKDFVLPHEKVTSVKSAFTSMFNRNRTKESQHALKDISFEIKKGEFFGIVGRNGSGKSTMLKILAGIYQPTKGKVHTEGKLVPFIELGVGFNPELTGRENVFLNGAMLGFSRKEIDTMYDEIVAFAELERFMDQKLKNYSSGMQVRLAFSMATRAKADILLVDEVLAVGDADFQRKCYEYFKQLKREKKTVVFVSHDMSAVREYCDRAVMIEQSEIVAAGDPDSVAIRYTRLFMQNPANAKLLNDNDQRWGDGKVKFTSVALKSEIIKNAEPVEVVAVMRAHEDAAAPIVGFSVRESSGSILIGTNTHIKHKKLPDLKRGDELTTRWTIPNIFGDGTYTLNFAVTHDDHWEAAAAFVSYRDEKTPYAINPDVKVTISDGRSRKD